MHINDTMQGLGMGARSIHCLISVMASRSCSDSFWISLVIALRVLIVPVGARTSVSYLHEKNPFRNICHCFRKIGPRITFSPDSDVESHPNASSTLWNDLLTELRNPGYFIAGGMAGMISRTCTAPLDRLKVYLIAQTSNKDAAVEAVKKGSPVAAARHFGQPLVDACKDLWAAGGIRSLFAGMYNPRRPYWSISTHPTWDNSHIRIRTLPP